MIAVLFARADSVYKTIPGCDVYDIDRDARKWQGGCQVVAHPPCRAWGRLRTFANPRKGERLLATWAVRQVRKWGGGYWNTRPARCCGQKLDCQQSESATNSADGLLEFIRTNGGIARRKQLCFTSLAASHGTYQICRRLFWEKRHTSSRVENAMTIARMSQRPSANTRRQHSPDGS